MIRWLVETGLAPRRTWQERLKEGRIEIDGEVIKGLSHGFNPLKSRVYFDGKEIKSAKNRLHYYMLNKPKGYQCTHAGLGRKVVDLFDNVEVRLFTIGRLDKDTTGLILVTNDGDLTQKIAHPSNQISKEYLVKVNKEVEDHHLKMMSAGCEVEGRFVKPKSVKKVRRNTFKVVVTDGRKHEVKHIAQSADLDVLELKRIRIGGLVMGNLQEGQWKEIGQKELEAIFH